MLGKKWDNNTLALCEHQTLSRVRFRAPEARLIFRIFALTSWGTVAVLFRGPGSSRYLHKGDRGEVRASEII